LYTCVCVCAVVKIFTAAVFCTLWCIHFSVNLYYCGNNNVLYIDWVLECICYCIV